MPFYLRALNNKNRWYRSSPPAWLPPNEIPAEPLADLVPKSGPNISIWQIEDDRSNLKRVAAAIASGRERVDKFDYAVFPQELVVLSGLPVTQSPGKTPDDFANTNWHRDLIEVTADKLVRLAKEMYVKAEISRILPMEIRQLILKGLQARQLQESKICDRLLNDLQGNE